MPRHGLLSCYEGDYLKQLIPKLVVFGHLKKLSLCWQGYFLLKMGIFLEQQFPEGNSFFLNVKYKLCAE